ncbi:MAG: glucosylglycerol 3-phosphatase [Leptolyngbyaceae bacterium]|nr:glucosylglycerol 3-phosphatase [Leptolyngbyaceae bacterium]
MTMPSSFSSTLHQETFSLRHDELLRVLSQTSDVLIIQDLDGVCMGLVKDPLTRVMDVSYIKAVQSFAPHFYVLTNGEHVGRRGVNRIVEKALEGAAIAQQGGYYLPGLAAGGVQWQDAFGSLAYPGVLEQELEFLATVPQRIQQRLTEFFSPDFFSQHPEVMRAENLQSCIDTATLDNAASPTANLNVFYDELASHPSLYGELQQAIANLMTELLAEAAQQGMADSFFVHYAPNLGRDVDGLEILRPVTDNDSGTTDFQFMLRGAVKEAGVLAILNHYVHQRTGRYPLGADFNARSAPKSHEALLQLVLDHFSPDEMPLMIGVGDTVNSTVQEADGKTIARRGGSDRNFLQLIQDIGQAMNLGNIVVYIDSSGGEVLNRKPLRIETVTDEEGHSLQKVVEGPGDPKDTTDPLRLNVVFPGGHQEYCALFQQAAKNRVQS